ncbi:PQQ-dependent sugar dehydrogenase [Candidatus Palauibacter sp.]|uniref:PQQ-dependent sugar dehydrogenase n=1 Tax=Candidatus Palauibacter sp. TaxID=3101350 RepID=UPI003C6FE68D
MRAEMIKRTPLAMCVAMFAAGLLLSIATPALGQEVMQSAYHDFRLVPVVEDLVRPWSIAFLPDGEMLVTEKEGRLRVVRDGLLLPEPVQGVPEVVSAGQGGLLDVVPHPEFEANRLLYLSFSKPNETERGTTAVIRGRYEKGALTDIEEIFVAVSEGRGHYGSRLVFDGQGHLFITVGERQAATRGDLYAHPAQDPSNHHGTVNRVYEDGGIPDDNPFIGDPNIRPEIWSYGHRNQQGFVIHPETGDLWATEHGPQGGDELNLIQPGLNYGWPVVGYGVNYGSGTAIHEGTHKEGMEPPVHFWVPSIAVSGLLLYTGDRFPHWKGNLFAGGMAGEQLARLTLDGQEVMREETLVQGLGRIRDVRQGPDGLIYLAIDGRRGEATAILRMEPVETR